MTRYRIPVILIAVSLGVALLFAAAPGLDLAVAGLFYRGDNSFSAQTRAGEGVRRILYWTPTAVLVLYVGLYAARRLGWPGFWAPSGRGLAFMALSFALGPGLLVNTVLKDHSHRPRPYQTAAFGGTLAFRPFYRFNGACTRNCSFVSGEGAAGAWTIAPALLTPPSVRAVAIVASLVLAASMGTLRMEFGGHYLSDTLFALLLVWLVVWGVWRLILPRRPSRLTADPSRKDA